MDNTARAPFNLEDLLRRVRAEVGSRRRTGGHNTSADSPRAATRRDQSFEAAPLTRVPTSFAALPVQPTYELSAFLAFHDEDFIRNAYRGILRREPDAQGLDVFLDALRTGRWAKIDVLGRIRYSGEGRAGRVRIRGLAFAFAIRSARRVPGLGRALGIAQYVLRLPELVRNHERLEAVVFHQRTRATQVLNALMRELDERHATLARRIERSLSGLDSANAALQGRVTEFAKSQQATADDLRQHVQAEADAARESIEQLRLRMNTQVEEITRVLSAMETSKMDRVHALHDIAEVTTSLSQLQETLQSVQRQVLENHRHLLASERADSMASPASAPAPTALPPSGPPNRLLDAFYVALEEHFRGSAADIRQRVSVYLPIIAEAAAGTSDAPVLDIGCGRGEWLEVVRDSGLRGSGIDSNVAMVELCRVRGLDVSAADAVSYLTGAVDASLGALTAFHLIEHLAFRDLIVLVDQAYRCLRRGGVAIFETPNPENLRVGACNFWLDPTHAKPLPPELMHFVLQARGFSRVEIVRLHPFPYELHFASGESEVRSRLNELLYGWQDYAVIGRKD